ncbi:MAG: hypothetical protein BMS9Abin10_0298 [Gammaproteobacteria bacterium]|nr:MAG: hypothetical protein BMS9Abin10_0298 [Gammaproteobacteria bacterium]
MRATHVTAALRALVVIGAGLLLSSCDSAGGGGAGGGVDNNGVFLFTSSIEPEDITGSTKDVDLVQGICDPGPPPEVEPFSDHDALVSFGTFTIDNVPTNATLIFITNYTIVYTINPNSFPGPVPPSLEVGSGVNIVVPVNGSVDATVSIFNVQQKVDFVAAGWVPFSEPSYTATYTFRGEDEFGRSVSTSASTELLLTDFNNCS